MKNLKIPYLFLSAQTYSITDEKTGRINEGISIWYIPDDNLDVWPPIGEGVGQSGEMSFGKKVAKMSLPSSKRLKLQAFPAIYEATLEFISVSQRQQVRITDIDFVATVRLVVDKAEKAPKS